MHSLSPYLLSDFLLQRLLPEAQRLPDGQHEESEENVVLMDADGARFQEYLIEAIYELGEKLQ